MFIVQNPGRELQQPPFEGRVAENASGGRGLNVFKFKFRLISRSAATM